ncbi:MAG: ABC transporter ATP-binding protein [Anaerolineaceae bacterium]|nr:ABC transporter ATP-binding protein [Anaerolineaceae bacterium]
MLKINQCSIQFDQTPILKKVSLEVKPGEIFGIIGPNGSGKTTLLRTISGILHPIEGDILVNGQSIDQISIQQRARLISSVPQAKALPGNFTAWDVVLFGRTPYLQWTGVPTDHDIQIVQNAMQTTNTTHLSKRLIRELSGGEQQRLLLARAIAQNTPILLLDEPITYLDLKHQIDILKQINILVQQRKLAVLITLHDLNWAAQFCHKIGILSHGELVSDGKPEQVLDESLLSEIYQTNVKIMPYPGNGKPLILPYHFSEEENEK